MFIDTSYTHMHTHTHKASPVALWVKNLPAKYKIQEVRVHSIPGLGNPLEEEMMAHSSILA